MINGHGNNIHNHNKQLVADFSSNVFNNPKTELILEHIRKNVSSVVDYPDCNYNKLRNQLASNHHLKKGNIWLSNGTTEAFYLLAHIFKNRTSVIPVPSFSEYEDACTLYNHKIEFIQSSDIFNNSDLKDKIIWLGHPNNPDGKYYPKNKLSALIESNSSTYFIIDEAYIDLCCGAESIIDKVSELSNLIILRSFTKLFRIPGIRLGYITAGTKIIQQVIEHHFPWAVNSLALHAGEYILDIYEELLSGNSSLLDESASLQKSIGQIKNMVVMQSSGNYFLVRLKKGKAGELQKYLLDEYSFLIRNASNFRGLNDSYFRIASQGEDLNNKLVEALNKWHNLNN